MSSLPLDFPQQHSLFSHGGSQHVSSLSHGHAPFSSEKWEAKYLPKPSIPLSHTHSTPPRRPSIHIMVRVPTAPQTRLLPSRVSAESEGERGTVLTKGFYYLFPIHPSEARRPTTAILPPFRRRQSEAMHGGQSGRGSRKFGCRFA